MRADTSNFLLIFRLLVSKFNTLNKQAKNLQPQTYIIHIRIDKCIDQYTCTINNLAQRNHKLLHLLQEKINEEYLKAKEMFDMSEKCFVRQIRAKIEVIGTTFSD